MAFQVSHEGRLFSNTPHAWTREENARAHVGLSKHLKQRLAASTSLFDTLFREWAGEGKRNRYSQKSKGLSHVLEEMDALGEKENRSNTVSGCFHSIHDCPSKPGRCVKQ